MVAILLLRLVTQNREIFIKPVYEIELFTTLCIAVSIHILTVSLFLIPILAVWVKALIRPLIEPKVLV